MPVVRVLVFLIAGPLSLGVLRADDGDQDKHELHGSWDLTEMVWGGKPFAVNVKGVRFVFEKNTFTIVPSDKTKTRLQKQKLRFTVNREVNPKWMDTTNLDGQFKGKNSVAIYKIEGGKLTICASTGDGARPTRFKSKEETMHVLYTLQRIKPKKEQPPKRPKSSSRTNR